MRSVLLAEVKKLEVRDVPVPKIKDDEILMKVEYAGICGSDMHMYHGVHAFRFPPVIVGHEVSGTVVEKGKNVTKAQIGDRITIMPLKSCMKCEWCLQNLPTHCKDRTSPGQGDWIGACVEYLNVREDLVFKLPDDVDTRLAVLTEPLAVAVHALKKIPVENRKRLLIMGAGAIGFLGLIAAQVMGFEKRIVSDVVDYNLQKALENGASRAINVLNEDLDKAVLEEFGPEKATGIFITAGPRNILVQALENIAKKGTISVIAIPPGISDIKITGFVFTEAQIVGSMVYNHEDFETCLDLLSRGKEKFEKAITHAYSFEQAQEAFDLMAEKKEGFLKSIFEV